MQSTGAVLATFGSHEKAEIAVKDLQNAGIDMHTLSILGKDFQKEERVVGFYNAGDRMRYWGIQGAWWGGFWGILFGSGLFFFPGVGSIVVLGPLVGLLVAGLENAVVVGGLSALGAALYSIGIPKDSVLTYETAISGGSFLLMAHGTPAEISRARTMLEPHGATNFVECGNLGERPCGSDVTERRSDRLPTVLDNPEPHVPKGA
jgi:hypothetical protein